MRSTGPLTATESATWQPQLVALDIDGTLLSRTGELPEQVKAAVQRVVEAGVPVVLATGRSWVATEPVQQALGLPSGPVVCSNGAVVVENPPFRLINQRTFNPAAVIRRVHELHPEAAIGVEVVGQGFRLNKHFPDGDLNGDLVIESIDELCREEVVRVVVRDPGADRADFIALAEQIGMTSLSYAIGWSAWLDIAPDGTTKATALDEICAELGVAPASVLALGDGRNDIEMLQWAGRGVALGDAPPEVVAAADDVTGLFDEDGTVTELSRWF